MSAAAEVSGDGGDVDIADGIDRDVDAITGDAIHHAPLTTVGSALCELVTDVAAAPLGVDSFDPAVRESDGPGRLYGSIDFDFVDAKNEHCL